MALGLAITLPLAYLLNIRFDEAYTLNTTANGIVDACQKAIGFGQQAPLYFALISIWRMIDPSIFFARFFSVLCFPLFIWVAFEVAKRYLKGTNPLFVAIVVTVHQQAIWNALDIRLYALMTLLSGLLLLLFYDGYLAEKPSGRSRVLYVIVAVLSLYTQYYLGFHLVAGAVVLLVLRRWPALSKYVLDMAIACVLFIPMLLVIGGQLGNVTGQLDTPMSAPEVVKNVYQRIISLLIPVEWIPSEFVKRWSVRGVVVVVGVLFVAKLVKHRKGEDVAIGVMVVVLATSFLFAISVVGPQLTETRHMSSMILPLAMIPFASLALLRNSRANFAWLGLILTLSITSLVVTYSPLAKPGDFERVAQFLMANEQPDQPVLVFHADAVWPLRTYYKGQNQLVALPQENALEKWDPRNNVLKDEDQILSRINSIPDSPERFWLVHDGWCAQGSLSFNCQLLEDAVKNHFIIESTETFLNPTTVRLLRRK
jgi:uncharacterized membrane protein